MERLGSTAPSMSSRKAVNVVVVAGDVGGDHRA
jgi:hypothetical protein